MNKPWLWVAIITLILFAGMVYAEWPSPKLYVCEGFYKQGRNTTVTRGVGTFTEGGKFQCVFDKGQKI